MFKPCFSLEQFSRSSPRLIKFKPYFRCAVKWGSPPGRVVTRIVQKCAGWIWASRLRGWRSQLLWQLLQQLLLQTCSTLHPCLVWISLKCWLIAWLMQQYLMSCQVTSWDVPLSSIHGCFTTSSPALCSCFHSKIKTLHKSKNIRNKTMASVTNQMANFFGRICQWAWSSSAWLGNPVSEEFWFGGFSLENAIAILRIGINWQGREKQTLHWRANMLKSLLCLTKAEK